MDLALPHVVTLIQDYGYWVLFLISIIEGPVITIIAGLLTSLGVLNFWISLLVLIVGDLTGDAFYYALGRYGGTWFIKHFGNYIGITEERVAKTRQNFHSHHLKIMLFAKTQPVGSVFLFTAGVSHTPFIEFLWYNLIGTVPKTILFLVVGLYFGQAYNSINGYLVNVAYLITGATLLIALYFWIKSYIKSHNKDLSV